MSDIWAVNQIYNGLVQLDDSLNIKPDIAKSWQVSEDGKEYTFVLRNDVFFHKNVAFGAKETRKVVASDFEYSFKRLSDKQVASPGKWTMNLVADIDAVNDTLLKIQLEQPFPPFLGMLGMKYCSVIPKEAVAFYDNDFRSNPVGTGPFYLKLWEENTKLVLRKNPLYFEKDEQGQQLPYLEAVAITFLPDKQSEFLQFIQGRLDFLNSIDPSYKDDLLTPEGNLRARYQQDIRIQKIPFLNTEYLGVYLPDSLNPLSNRLLRKAVNHGFDREKMIMYLRNGIGEPGTNGFLPKGLPGYVEQKGFSYDPALAKSLVEQYRQETGSQQVSISITTNSQYVDLCEFIQRELENVGITVKIDVVPPSTLRQMKANGKAAIFRASWIADYPDAENYFTLFYSKNFAPNGPNYTHFKNSDFDAYYEQAIQLVDEKSRYVMYRKMDSLIIAESPVIPLYYDEVVRFTQKNIVGMGVNPTNLLILKSVKKN